VRLAALRRAAQGRVIDMKRLTVFGLAGVLLLAGCASNDEGIACRDRKIQEKACESESLMRQNADLKSTNLVMQTEIEAKNREIQALETRQQAVAASPAPEAVPAGARSSRPVVRIDVADKDVLVDSRDDGTSLVRLSGGAAFEPGSTTLTKRGKEALKKVASEIKASKASIRIEGHTDATPLTGRNKETYGTNQNLSIARALAVQDYLVNTCKVSKSQIDETVGLGDSKPIDATNTKAAHAKNRRIDIIVRG
jgi:flagellar motor protein MotB